MRTEKRYNLWVDSFMGNRLVLENEILNKIMDYCSENGIHKDICNLEEVKEGDSK